MFAKLKQLWDDKGFEIVLGLCIAFILIYGLYCKITGNTGTWSTKQNFSLPTTKETKRRRSPAPPRESKGEMECRRVLQYLFKRPFNKDRPDFLRNPVTGGNFNLELDCYDPELKIAVEYNGVQHYQYVPYFHKNKEAFLNQKYRDQMKRQKCREQGIVLIEVPNTVKLEDIKGYIEKELKRNGIQF
jgi:hypothetical protein